MNYPILDLSSHKAEFHTSWHQLIILGNGFDLQCGLRSKFGDFFKPRFDTISSNQDYRRETWEKLVEQTDLTLWDFILEANIDSLWCDIEGTIERWVLSAGFPGASKPPFNRAVEFVKRCPFPDAPIFLLNNRTENEQDDASHMYGNMARYTWVTYPEIATDGYSHELFMTLLRQELIKLEYAFGKYLANEVATNESYEIGRAHV